MRRYEASELAGMTARKLQEIGTAAGIKKPFNKNHTTPVRVERILRHYAKLDAAAAVPPSGAGAENLRPASPEFEAAVHDQNSTPVSTTSPPVGSVPLPVGRGGAREGAGRKVGQTNEVCRMAHLSEVSHPGIKGLFRLLFVAWATAVGTDKVELSDEQAEDLALPWTHLCEYRGWTEYIPVWIEDAVTATWNTINIFKTKARVAREYRAEQKKAVGEQDLAAGGKSE